MMSAKLFLRLAACTTLAIGLMLILMPGFVEDFFVAAPDHGGDIFIRFLGSALLGYSYLNWYTAQLKRLEDMRATFVGNLSTLTVAFVISLVAVLDGTLNARGWLIVLLHFGFGAGFAVFTFKVRRHLR
jgi:hypothetical protein